MEQHYVNYADNVIHKLAVCLDQFQEIYDKNIVPAIRDNFDEKSHRTQRLLTGTSSEVMKMYTTTIGHMQEFILKMKCHAIMVEVMQCIWDDVNYFANNYKEYDCYMECEHEHRNYLYEEYSSILKKCFTHKKAIVNYYVDTCTGRMCDSIHRFTVTLLHDSCCTKIYPTFDIEVSYCGENIKIKYDFDYCKTHIELTDTETDGDSDVDADVDEELIAMLNEIIGDVHYLLDERIRNVVTLCTEAKNDNIDWIHSGERNTSSLSETICIENNKVYDME